MEGNSRVETRVPFLKLGFGQPARRSLWQEGGRPPRRSPSHGEGGLATPKLSA